MTNTKQKKTKAKRKKNKKKTNAKITFKKLDKKSTIIISVCSIIVIALIISAIAIHFSSPNHPMADFDKDVAFGIDISAHNGDVDWQETAKEADFAFIRVGYRGYAQGNLVKDKKASYNLKHANKAKIPTGIYFYSQAVTVKEAEEEAEFALKQIKKYDISLPIAYDVEYAYNKHGEIAGRLYDAKLSKDEQTEIVNAFCKVISDAGYTPACYASTYFYESKLNPGDFNRDIVRWVADYNKNITYDGKYDIWQFSNTGKCKGVSSKYVDTNYWYIRR